MATGAYVNPFGTETESDTTAVSSSSKPSNIPSSLTYDDVAAKLLRDSYVLTALELYTELAERGRESPKLRDFFSNPSNFERNVQVKQDGTSNLERTASVTTFDSLDFARYSDDGDQQLDEKVAVLEFELRKARETIKSLRATLTEAAVESDPNTPERDTGQKRESISESDVQPLKPHELRALNFLVNEYLLKHNYKLTSITFSDENEDQDFEDWDDVGLNTSKPPGILHLYRDYGKHQQILKTTVTRDVSIQTEDIEMISSGSSANDNLEEELMTFKNKYESLTNENKQLMEQMKHLERDLEKTVSHNIRSSTPTVTPFTTPRKAQAVAPFSVKSTRSSSSKTDLESAHELSAINSESVDPQISLCQASTNILASSSLHVEVSSNLETEVTNDGINVEISKLDIVDDDTDLSFSGNRKIPESFKKHLYEICYHRRPLQDPRLSSEVSKVVDSNEKIVLMLGRCLPYIIPNVILAKREELIPVILATISTHPEANERDNLLHLLFNLIKRPDSDQRQVILSGFVSIARHLGPTRVEAELLPQCWEQISHKYVERRLLVAESCGILAPHIPTEIRNSLVLSMLQQIVTEDKSEDVRIAAVRSLAMIYSLIDEPDKVTQGLELVMQSLMDSSEAVVDAVIATFLPAIAIWLLQLNQLLNRLIMYIMNKLCDIVKTKPRSLSISLSSVVPSTEEHQISVLICCLQTLIPYLFVAIIVSGPYCELDGESQSAILELSRFPHVSDDPLHNPAVIFGDKIHLQKLLHLYDEYVNQEWYKSWDELDWLHKSLLPALVNLLCSSHLGDISSVVLSLTSLMSSICRAFGRPYTITRIIPLFQQALIVADEELDQVKNGSTGLTQAIVPVYAGGVLAVFSQEDDRAELHKFLLNMLTTLSLCHSSLQSIHTAIAQLCENSALHELLLSVLWEGVVHTSPLVRISSAKLFQLLVTAVNQTLLANRIIPALVTYATDSDMIETLVTLKKHVPVGSDRLFDIELIYSRIIGVQARAIRFMTDKVKLKRLQVETSVRTILIDATVIDGSALLWIPNWPTKGTVAYLIAGCKSLIEWRLGHGDGQVWYLPKSPRSVRTAAVEAFGIVLQTSTSQDVLDKVKMQFQTFLDDAVLRDHHPLHLELIHTFAVIAPNLEPSFREEFILPRLAVLASRSNNSTNDTKRLDIALALLEAYSALSCCTFSSSLIGQSVVPGLQCLLTDIRSVAPQHEKTTIAMIHEFESKMDVLKPVDRNVGSMNSSSLPHQLSASGMEDMKNKVTKYFSQHRPTTRPNIPNIFQMKKK
ncbi:LisH domain and HEAT repeat-containing protein KIAA1468 [Nymphon striatum]|nr:LisH domain and HEAT repeat-containing protein KIAA1468 [Nymphon striatum]